MYLFLYTYFTANKSTSSVGRQTGQMKIGFSKEVTTPVVSLINKSLQ